MKYLVIGAGGTGGFLAANLAEAGLDVTVIARGEHLRKIREEGLILETPERGEYRVRVKACDMEEYLARLRGGPAADFPAASSPAADFPAAAGPDVIFVCVKGYSLDGAVSFIRDAAGRDAVVVPLLNIYGTGGRMQRKLPGVTVTDGCIYISSNITAPGRLKRHGRVFRVVFGPRRGQAVPEEPMRRILEAERDLNRSGIEGILSEEIERDALLKFSYVSPQAGCGLFYGAKAGEIQQNAELRGFFVQLVREVAEVASAMGFDLGEDVAERNLAILDALEPTASTSMQRDLERGGQSEFDGLISEVVRLGEQYGVAVPGYWKIWETYKSGCK